MYFKQIVIYKDRTKAKVITLTFKHVNRLMGTDTHTTACVPLITF